MNEKYQFLSILAVVSALIWFGQFIPELIITVLSIGLFAAIAWFRPRYLLSVLIIYFVSRPFLVELNGGLKLAGDIAIIVLLLRVVFNTWRNNQFSSIFKLEIYEWAYIGFILVGIISALMTGIGLVPIIFQVRKFVMLYLLYYGLKRLVWTDRDVYRHLNVIVSMAMVLSIHGIIEKLSQRQWLIPVTWRDMFLSPTNIERVYGILGNPNSMGLFMVGALVATVYLLNKTKSKMYYVPLVFVMGIILLTYSRGTWLAALVAGIVYFVLTRNWRLFIRLALVGAIGFALVYTPVEQFDAMIESGGKITISEPKRGWEGLTRRSF